MINLIENNAFIEEETKTEQFNVLIDKMSMEMYIQKWLNGEGSESIKEKLALPGGLILRSSLC